MSSSFRATYPFDNYSTANTMLRTPFLLVSSNRNPDGVIIVELLKSLIIFCKYCNSCLFLKVWICVNKPITLGYTIVAFDWNKQNPSFLELGTYCIETQDCLTLLTQKLNALRFTLTARVKTTTNASAGSTTSHFKHNHPFIRLNY